MLLYRLFERPVKEDIALGVLPSNVRALRQDRRVCSLYERVYFLCLTVLDYDRHGLSFRGEREEADNLELFLLVRLLPVYQLHVSSISLLELDNTRVDTHIKQANLID